MWTFVGAIRDEVRMSVAVAEDNRRQHREDTVVVVAVVGDDLVLRQRKEEDHRLHQDIAGEVVVTCWFSQ